jgi:[acyl-carrier-protein] S-malonyltransferase
MDAEFKKTSKLAFLFPGQGSQYMKMGAHLYEQYAPCREIFATADRELELPLTQLIMEGPESKLTETEITQPAILTVSVATGHYLVAHGVVPDLMAGHSLGEYSALVLAGSIEFAQAVRLVRLRGRFMQQAVPAGAGTMAAVLGLEDQAVERLCEQVNQSGGLVEPAGYNCPGQLVVAGRVESVAALIDLAKAAGGKCTLLKVSAPFHCSMLRPAAVQLAAELCKIDWRPPRIPYIANVDAKLTAAAAEIQDKLAEQVCNPVRWSATLRQMLMMRVERFVEVGPGRVCVGHLKKVERRRGDRAATFAITDKEADLKEVLDWLGKSAETS